MNFSLDKYEWPKNFLSFLIQKRRFFFVERILKSFIEICSEKRGELKAELRSAKQLSNEEIKQITEELTKNFSSKIKLNYKHDESLIGGLVVQVGSTMVDTSIKSKLQQRHGLLNEISKVFLGKNDFSSFAKVEKNTNPKREIFKSVWKRNSGIFIYTITGNSFLRNMVRNLVGVQLAFNDKKLTLKEIKSQLDKPDGNRLNYIAPANGLTLWKVKY